MKIRETFDSDLEDILTVERVAFGKEDESLLVRNLLQDESAKPLLSLLAYHKNKAVGHILFTRVWFEPNLDLSAMILAPLAVIPDFQKQGVGKQLIARGLQVLKQRKIELVFVLGDPNYYRRYGFKPALPCGFQATYPLPEKYADAWMVVSLSLGGISQFKGKVVCADQLNKPEYWVE